MSAITHNQAEFIRVAQRRVEAMVAERRKVCSTRNAANPSRYWVDFCSTFDYMQSLAPESFAKLRLHTYHLTGDNYQTYYFGNRSAFLDYWGPWLATNGLPAEHVLHEPDDGIGFRLEDGRLVSQDTARFQRAVSSLSRHGILDQLRESATAPQIIEIGGGYGGLAFHLTRILPKSRYIIVDLAETLVFSATYLALHAPEKRLFLYDPETPVTLDDLENHDLVLLPAYRLDLLQDCPFDLAISMASLQEMRADQVKNYLDFLRRTCRGVFYSCNRDRQKGNDELLGLFDLIKSRFEMTELLPLSPHLPSWKGKIQQGLRASLLRTARTLGLLDGAPTSDPYPFVEHLCRAHPNAAGS